jgi:fumarylacetoacetase
MLLPFTVRDYVDFYSSLEHATNLGRMFRPDAEPLLPNWRHLPIGYHSRASTVVVSGTPIRRPSGQHLADGGPVFGPTQRLDIELELAFVTGGAPNGLGDRLAMPEAARRIFGFVLMNDWSARDIQAWEYQPLGPFLAKNFCTSISPWVVTLEALDPFRKPLAAQNPAPMSYLKRANDFTFDIQLEARLQTKMGEPQRITRSNFQNLYWSIAQQLAHHTVNGCNLQPADLLASGTISGSTEESRGCMLELTWRGQNPLKLADGETRKWLEDGDTLSITGWCQGDGYRVGFGEVSGRIIGA